MVISWKRKNRLYSGRMSGDNGGPSANLSTSNRTLSPPCSITTPSPSTATNFTPGPTLSPCKKLLGGPSFKLKIATAPRLPAITPLTLISTGAV
ncbi:hypothetical protein EMIT0P260_90248 [Pseudomonas sp. IT-P260]